MIIFMIEALDSTGELSAAKKTQLRKYGATLRDVVRIADRRGRHLGGAVRNLFEHAVELLESRFEGKIGTVRCLLLTNRRGD